MRMTFWPIFDHRASEVLADQSDCRVASGTLDANLHLPGEWLSVLMEFIATILPGWRDDPVRPVVTSETVLSAQLCSRLNGACRHGGWDFIQFKQEEPDEASAQRTVDLAVSPAGATLWIEGREYTEYRTLFPIECKRLPTPSGTNRDEREYLYSRYSTTGGVQRFKDGHHGSMHLRAAMIGYVQSHSVTHWQSRLNAWIDDLVRERLDGWTLSDRLGLISYDRGNRLATLRSQHGRYGLNDIVIDHFWIEM